MKYVSSNVGSSVDYYKSITDVLNIYKSNDIQN